MKVNRRAMDDTIKAQIDAFDQELSEYQKKQDVSSCLNLDDNIYFSRMN